MEGLEPPRIAPPDPKSGAATNYATCAVPGFGCFVSGFGIAVEIIIADRFEEPETLNSTLETALRRSAKVGHFLRKLADYGFYMEIGRASCRERV